MSSAEGYKDCFRDTVYLLVEKTMDASIYGGSEFNSGYRMALYAALSLIHNQAQTFGLDLEEVGFHGFEPDRWLREGQGYWNG